MSWVRLDDAIFSNRKMVEVSGPAKLLHLAGICYCAQALTDGLVSKRAWNSLAAQTEAKPKHVDQLVAAGLWHDLGEAWEIHDYLEYNPSREKVLASRAGAKERKERWKERVAERVPDGVRSRAPYPSRPHTKYPPVDNGAVEIINGRKRRFITGTGWVEEVS